MKSFKRGKEFSVISFSSILLLMLVTGFPVGSPAVAANHNDTDSAFSAPDFQLQDLNGSDVTLSQFKGQKPVLLYFWATWCHFCLAVRPEVIKLRKATADADIVILAIDVGSGDSLEKVKRFEQKDPAPYTVLYDPDSKVTRSYKVEGVPHFVLLNKNGEVKYKGSQLPTDPMSLLR